MFRHSLSATEKHRSVRTRIPRSGPPNSVGGWYTETAFLQRTVNPELQSELRCQDEGRNLDQFIDLAIHLDNLIHSGRPPRDPPALNISVTEELEPMQIGHTRLTAEESTQRIKHHLWPGRTLPGNMPSFISLHQLCHLQTFQTSPCGAATTSPYTSRTMVTHLHWLCHRPAHFLR